MSEAEDAQKLSAPEASPDALGPANGSASAPALNADGRERPRFLLEFPSDPALQQLVAAFEAGNYRAVREGAAKLVESSEDPIVAAAARELARRIEPDPLMKYLLFVALGLFVAVVWYAYQGPH